MAFTKDTSKQILFRYSLQSFGLILLLAILIRTFFFSSYVMSGVSMLPSVWPGDFLVGSKMRLWEIQRGDVVALRCPNAKDKLCLKRVVGLPGDRIEFRDESLVLNGRQARLIPAGVFATESFAGRSHAIWPASASGQPLPGPVVIPPRSVYLLGDKRGDLDDSRTWGPVAQDFVEAKIVRVWMSLDWYDGERVRAWPRIRAERLLRSID